VFAQILAWAKERSCKFLISPIDAQSFYSQKASRNPEALRFEFPWEAAAFNVVLAIHRHQKAKKNNKGRTLVICDELVDHSDRLLRLFAADLSFTDTFTGYKPKKKAPSPPRLDQIIDVPHFSRSHMAVLIQIADYAAFITRAHLELEVYGVPEAYLGEAAKLKGCA
jgi:hypothetical protein